MYMSLLTGKNTPNFAKDTVYRFNEAAEIDKRTVGYKRRKLSMEKGTHVMLSNEWILM